MFLNKPVKGVRGRRDLPEIVHVVAGKPDHRLQIRQGQIKELKFFSNVVPDHILHVQWGIANGRRTVLIALDVLPSLKEKGWALLHDLYEAEGRLDDYAEYLKWAQFAREGRTTKPFPEEFLPDKVLEMRKSNGFDDEWVPPVRNKAKSHGKTSASA